MANWVEYLYNIIFTPFTHKCTTDMSGGVCFVSRDKGKKTDKAGFVIVHGLDKYWAEEHQRVFVVLGSVVNKPCLN